MLLMQFRQPFAPIFSSLTLSGPPRPNAVQLKQALHPHAPTPSQTASELSVPQPCFHVLPPNHASSCQKQRNYSLCL